MDIELLATPLPSNQHSTSSKVLGRMILCNDVQPKKALKSMRFREAGKVTVVKDEQSRKASEQILVIPSGMVIPFKFLCSSEYPHGMRWPLRSVPNSSPLVSVPNMNLLSFVILSAIINITIPYTSRGSICYFV